ncbi:hypothetical protein AAG570_005696 [Ranatra chinensis]|uniref:Uncharacterized protein n=1 Tax=Ranatra chinensis TaxID=642074 RepID=A0ABD0XY62_9HEMI
MFQQENNIFTFWLRVKKDFPVLIKKDLEILLLFIATYLRETGFSAVWILKTKYRSRLVIENELRTAISTMIRGLKKCVLKNKLIHHTINTIKTLVNVFYLYFCKICFFSI